MNLNLLEKTELWIENLKLKNADLNAIADVVAHVLQLPRARVLVVDVRENQITLDILQQQIEAAKFFGKKKQLLAALAKVPGVEIFSDTHLHSDGILGFIALDEVEARKALENTSKIRTEIKWTIRKRVIVFPTGFEVKRGLIKDTNTPLIQDELQKEGFKVSVGEALDDDPDLIAGKIRRSIDEGFGVIITTGGIGAEDKDKTVESILKIDPEAATPYLIMFKKGTGRHKKDGVRIGVGESSNTLIVALPGPNDEVKVSLAVLIKALKSGVSKQDLADRLAEVLREKCINPN